MGKLVRKKKRKRLLYIWLPLIIMLVVTAVAQGITYLQETLNPPAEETVQEREAGFTDQVLSQIKDKVADEISKGITRNLFVIIKGVLIPVIILIAIAWVLWAFYTKRLYQSWLAESLEKYLRLYVESFQRENRLLKKEEESFERLERLVLECYAKVFSDVFGEVFDVAAEESLGTKIQELRRKWNKIRYL